MFVNLLKYLVFGTLSDDEVHILSGKTRHTIWEFVAGFLVFYSSADFGHELSFEALKYGGLFLCVLLVKFFGFLVADRVHKLYFSPPTSAAGSTKYGYWRLGLGIAVLNFVNILLLYKFIHDVMWRLLRHHNALITIFGFEVLNHCPSTISTSFIFALNCYETMIAQRISALALKRWRRKKLGYIYALEFLLSLMRFSMTTVFSLFFLYHYTFPFHSVPSSYISLKMMIAKARALVDLLKQDIIFDKLKVPKALPDCRCIVCYEDLNLSDKEEIRSVIPCEHSFHEICLRRWLKVSPTCPVCRQKI